MYIQYRNVFETNIYKFQITSSERSVSESPEQNPCKIKPPAMPDFRKPGQRISTESNMAVFLCFLLKIKTFI